MIAKGAAMSPSIAAQFPRYQKIFRGRQTARSLHFLGLLAFILFIIVHIIMVTVERFPENMGNIVLGKNTSLGVAVGLFALLVISVLIVHIWATNISLNKPRLPQNTLDKVIMPFKKLFFNKAKSNQKFYKTEVSPFFRVNGLPPDTKEYQELVENNFKNYNLRIFGLVEKSIDYSLADLQSMSKLTQITEHFCIQGWTAIAEWAGVPMYDIIASCKPYKEAHYIVFHSYQITDEDEFYEVLDLELAKHKQTILAYEMNGKPLTIPHGAPLRLRVETQLGYKMVKWIRSIEFVSSYKNIGMGQGGHREDHMYYSRGAGI
jgi:DMSO/TMAO reductase YedYZ molybdopterin-dependent catalytic subunit